MEWITQHKPAVAAVSAFVLAVAFDKLDYPRFLVYVAIILGLAGIAFALTPAATVEKMKPYLPQLEIRSPQTSIFKKRAKERLRATANATAAAVHGLITEYEAAQHEELRKWREAVRLSTNEESDAVRINEVGRLSTLLLETVRRYETDHSADALWCYDEFHRRGLTGDTQRLTFEWPVNTFGLREIAQRLGVWAKRL